MSSRIWIIPVHLILAVSLLPQLLTSSCHLRLGLSYAKLPVEGMPKQGSQDRVPLNVEESGLAIEHPTEKIGRGSK